MVIFSERENLLMDHESDIQSDTGTRHCDGTHLDPDTPPEEALDALRKEIAEIDLSIMELMACRMGLARDAARFKSALDLPLKEPQVEERVRSRMAHACDALKLDPELGSDLAALLIRHALRCQEGIMDSGREKPSKA